MAFLALPAGTIFCRGHKWFFGNLAIKGDSLRNDFFAIYPSWPDSGDIGESVGMLEASLRTGGSFACETTECRDGRFDQDDVFLVYETADLEWLRDRITDAIGLSKGKGEKV